MVVTRMLASLCGGSESFWKDGKHCTHTHAHAHTKCFRNADSDWSTECATNRVNFGSLLNTYSCNAALMMISKAVKTCS